MADEKKSVFKENMELMLNPDNIQKYFLGTKKSGQPRAAYDIIKDLLIDDKKKKKKGKKGKKNKHKNNPTNTYSFFLDNSSGKKKHKKKKKKGKNKHWHI